MVATPPGSRRMTQSEVWARQLRVEKERRDAMKPWERLIEDLNKECPVDDVTFMFDLVAGVGTVMIAEEDAYALLEFFTHYEPYPNG